VSFTPRSIPKPGAGKSTMKVTVGAKVKLGTYKITINATGGGVSHTAALTLDVVN
jgi:uncharacterized membrane protein